MLAPPRQCQQGGNGPATGGVYDREPEESRQQRRPDQHEAAGDRYRHRRDAECPERDQHQQTDQGEQPGKRHAGRRNGAQCTPSRHQRGRDIGARDCARREQGALARGVHCGPGIHGREV